MGLPECFDQVSENYFFGLLCQGDEMAVCGGATVHPWGAGVSAHLCVCLRQQGCGAAGVLFWSVIIIQLLIRDGSKYR